MGWIACSCNVLNLYDSSSYAEDGSNLTNVNKPTDYSHCFYTSGTTGMPKGAINRHNGLINRIMWAQKTCPLSEKDTMLQKTVITFDDSLSELLWWSFVGAKVAMLPVDEEKDVVAIRRAIEQYGVTVLFIVPTVLSYINMTAEADHAESSLKTLRYLFSSGEELKPQLLNKTYEVLDKSGANCDIYNVYGPTEASVDITGIYCERGSERVTIGRPISNNKAYILRGNTLCGIGMPGELCVAGVHIGAGYLNRPDLTEKAFVEDPFNGGIMYRTGDLARLLPDGTIEYLGRVDEQIKIRGQRVELGEIESAIRTIEKVKDCAVIAKKDGNGEAYLCAYYVSDEE